MGERRRRVPGTNADSGRLGRKAVAIADSGRLGRWVPDANADAVEIRWQFAPSASHLHSSAQASRGVPKAQTSLAESLRILQQKNTIFLLRGLGAMCLQQQSWICTFEYPSVQSWGKSASGERTASMSKIDCCS